MIEITSCGLRVTGYELRVTGYELRVAGCEKPGLIRWVPFRPIRPGAGLAGAGLSAQRKPDPICEAGEKGV